MMHKRFILVSKEIGVYLGSCLGMFFWSGLDAVGQDAAVTFPSGKAALDFLVGYPGKFSPTDEITVREVTTQDPEFATIAECVAVGVPDWSYTINGVLSM